MLRCAVLRYAVTLFWLAFLFDGVLSLGDQIASLAGGIPPLTAARNTVALAVLVASFPIAGVAGLTPRAPKRTLLPLILFAWWAGPAMAFPLAIWEVPHLALGLAIAQVTLALGVWFAFHRARWNRPFSVNETTSFSWGYLVVAAPATAFLFLILTVASTVVGFATQVELLTGGYVRVRPDGVYLIERKFQSGDREVRLTGMMHVASREFYSGLLSGIDPAVPSVVLVEGVTDRRRLLGGKILGYERLARLLNLTSQSDSAFSEQVVAGLRGQANQIAGADQSSEQPAAGGIDYRHADVDVESFHPQTIAFILAVVGLFQSSDLRQFLLGIVDPSSPITNEGAQEQVLQDILFARNRRLAAEIEFSLRDYRRIIVPWGAMHLPEIESWLLARNFVESDEIERKALAFW